MMNYKIFDPSTPWKLPQDEGAGAYPSYSMSEPEWKVLLDKAQEGDPEAQWEVADSYQSGCKDDQGNILVERSPQKAAEWFRNAAEAGHAPAQNNLGVMLGDGDGVEKDPVLALHWLKKAWKRGDSCAPQNIAITYRDMGKLKRAVHWFEKCAETGDDDAILQVGIHCFWGKGVTKDWVKAVYCYQRAIEGKNIAEASRDDAYFYLAIAYLEGQGVTKSVPKAKRLLKRANRDNDHLAARALLHILTTAHRAREG